MTKCLEHRDRSQSEPACTDQDNRLVRCQWHDFLDGRIDGDARAGKGRCQRRVDVTHVHQELRIGDDHLLTESAILQHADAVGFVAGVVVAFEAPVAKPAAEPGKDDALVANRNTRRVGTELGDAPDDFVSRRARQNHAAISQAHGLAASHIVGTLPEVKVGVADPAIRYLEDHFSALGLPRGDVDQLQWSTILDYCPCFHCFLLCVLSRRVTRQTAQVRK